MHGIWRIAPLVAALAWANPPGAKDRYLFEPPDADQSLANRYATLSSDDCLTQLKARGVPFEKVDPTAGVDTPIRFTGPIRGVSFRPTWRTQPDDKAPA